MDYWKLILLQYCNWKPTYGEGDGQAQTATTGIVIDVGGGSEWMLWAGAPGRH